MLFGCCPGLPIWLFLKPDFEILAFLKTFGFFWKAVGKAWLWQNIV